MKEHNVQQGNGKVRSISEALDLLNAAADNSAEEIRGMISHDYRKLKGILDDIKPDVKTAYSGLRQAATDSLYATKDRAAEMSKDVAKRVDKSAHENVWTFLGVAAFFSLIFGFMIGRRSSN
jgi:ElaB/YqjD/DUF883 family membrane-anchored ribosome-binding protein